MPGELIEFVAVHVEDYSACPLIAHVWNFGDGTPVENTPFKTITHRYEFAGVHDVVLVVAVGNAIATLHKNVAVAAPVPSVSVTGLFALVSVLAIVAMRRLS